MLRLRRDSLLFPGGRPKALTLSYDDGVTQDERLILLMKKYGIRGTFNLNAGLMGHRDWLVQPGIDVSHYKIPKEQIAAVYGENEIAVHTMTHPDLVRVSSSTAVYEMAECRKELEDIVKRPVTGMAYPMGTWNEQVKDMARACGIRYARTTKQTLSFSMPDDFLEWHPTCHHGDVALHDLTEEFLSPVKPEEADSPMLFYVWGHAYEFDAFGQWGEMEAFLNCVSGKDDVWYASNGEIQEYTAAAEMLIYSASGDYIYNPTCTDIWLQIDGEVRCVRAGKILTVEFVHHND